MRVWNDLIGALPFLNFAGMLIIGVAAFLVSGQTGRIKSTETLVSAVKVTVDHLDRTLQLLNVTLVELKTAFHGHTELVSEKFKGIDERLNAQRLSIETVERRSKSGQGTG